MINKFSGSDDVHDLDPRWNCLDGEDRDISDIYQLHYTKMATQPWDPAWFTGTRESHPRSDVVAQFYDTHQASIYKKFPWTMEYEQDITYGCIGR